MTHNKDESGGSEGQTKVSQRPGKAQHPLAHRYGRNHVIDDLRRDLDHASRAVVNLTTRIPEERQGSRKPGPPF